LEAVRLLTNLETEKRKLLQVVLFGQPELDQRLNEKGVRQLKQRITFSYKLQPLSEDAVSTYISYRLQVAGYRGRPMFEPQAIRQIYKASRGTPRLVNILSHKCLLAAFGRGERHVDATHARMAINDTEGAFQQRAWWPLLLAGTLSGIAALTLWLTKGTWGGWLP
ncbi:MAG: AAA family ATPase, partial [Gammaproteobacteria bacterium]|nr:AAA family ATPase [Gammaproteobacteria bacterium]